MTSQPTQFTEWYHGTSRDAGAAIAQAGLGADYYGTDDDGFEYSTLTTDPVTADSYARYQGGEGIRTMVTVRIPSHLAAEYLTEPAGAFTGLNKPLPVHMIHRIEAY